MATFRSKYDVWLVGLALSLVPVLWTSVAVSRSTGSEIVSAVLAALATAILIWTLRVMRYDLTATTLEIRSGPLRWTIPIASIRSVEPSREVWSAPAWSLDRLRVTASERTVLISPNDKAGFLDALSARDRGLQRDGDRLVRSAVA